MKRFFDSFSLTPDEKAEAALKLMAKINRQNILERAEDYAFLPDNVMFDIYS